MGSITCAARVSVEKTIRVRVDAIVLDKVALEYMSLVARDSVVKMECV